MVDLRRRGTGESGASLVLVIAFILFFSITATALLSAEWTSNRASPPMVSARATRYRGDAAAATAVNWIKVNPALGRDPAVFTSDLPCALRVPTPTGTLTATCVGDTGSGALATGTWPTATPLQPRVVTIVTCTRGAGRANAVTPCDASAGDELLVRARVRFDVTTDDASAAASNVPEVLSWKHLS